MERKPAGSEVSYLIAPDNFWLGRTVEARQEADAKNREAILNSRRDTRKKIQLEALVNCGLTYSVPWRIRDLSTMGAFVEMDPMDFSEGMFVELVLRFEYKDRPIDHRLPARVTRIEPRGIALRFGNYDDQTYTDLINLLYAM